MVLFGWFGFLRMIARGRCVIQAGVKFAGGKQSSAGVMKDNGRNAMGTTGTRPEKSIKPARGGNSANSPVLQQPVLCMNRHTPPVASGIP
jgi:hypothetical protein